MIFEQFLSQICPREKVESWKKTKKDKKVKYAYLQAIFQKKSNLQLSFRNKCRRQNEKLENR